MRTYYKIFEVVESPVRALDSKVTSVLEEPGTAFNQFDTLEEAERYMEQWLDEYVNYTILKIYRVDTN